MISGIQIFAQDGSSGWIVDLVVSLHLPLGWSSVSSGSVPSSLAGHPGGNSAVVPPHDRLRPLLPPLPLFDIPFVQNFQRLHPLPTDDLPLQLRFRPGLRRALGLASAAAAPPLGAWPSAAPHGPQMSSPFMGSFSAVSWNTQALFAADPERHAAKAHHLNQLMASHDIGCWSETHGTGSGNAAWKGPLHCRSWWSPGPAAGLAGVGITVREGFLRRFTGHRWEIIFPGRAAVLRLWGPQGSLDIYTVYFHTGADVPSADLLEVGLNPQAARQASSAELREALRHRLFHALRP